MPRRRKLVTDRSSKNIFAYQQAYKELQSNKSLRKAAEMFDLDHVSLSRYKKKRESAPENTPVDDIAMGYNSAKKIFTPAQENEIVTYAIKSADIYFGLTAKDMRKLAYDLTVRYELRRPATWDENEIAGVEWFRGFLDRHPELSVRCAQATSLARATSFNKNNVDEFFDNLAMVLDRDNFEHKDIYNVDETGVTTVQKPNRIVAKKGTRQVGALTSAERGTLVTITVAANAIGNVLPPMFTFPRVRYQTHFLRDGPVGSVGTANKSGWMQEEDFLVFLQHFQRHTNCSLDHKVLLLLDNHASHVSIKCIDYCRDNGIVMLSFPPHCSHKLQPLDRSVYGPFKKAVNTACDGWMRANPGKTMTIYDIPGIVATALPRAMTLSNIQAGFRVSGICPYNRQIFSDLDFAPSYVTDRPNPNIQDLDISQPISSAAAERRVQFPQTSLRAPRSNSAAEIEVVPLSSPSCTVNPQPNSPVIPVSEIQHDLISPITLQQPEPAAGLEAAVPSSPIRSVTPQPKSTDIPVSVIQPDLTSLMMPQQPVSHSPSSFVELDPLDVTNYNNQPSTSKFLPECIRPFPKAPPRQTTRNATKRKSAVYTDTPEKENIRIQTDERERKRNASKIKTNMNREEKKKKTNKTTKNKKKSSKRIPKTSSSEDDTDTEMPQFPESDDEYDVTEDIQFDSSSYESSASENEEEPNLQIEDWVIVNILSMKNLVHRYVGQIKSITEHGYIVRFAKKIDHYKFKWPVNDDISEITRLQVVKKIDRPTIKSNSRRVILLEFEKSLKKFNIE